MELELIALYDVLLPLIATILTILGTWIGKRALTYLGLQNDEKIRSYLERAMDKGALYAVHTMQKRLPDNVKFDRETLAAIAAAYVVRSVPDAVAHFSITSRRLEEMTNARLDEWTMGPLISLNQEVILSAPSQTDSSAE